MSENDRRVRNQAERRERKQPREAVPARAARAQLKPAAKHHQRRRDGQYPHFLPVDEIVNFTNKSRK